MPCRVERCRIESQVRLEPERDALEGFRGHELRLRRADECGDPGVGACLVFPVRAAVAFERLDAIAEAAGDVLEEVALWRGDDLRIRELAVPEIEDVGIAPVPHRNLVVVQPEELHRVEWEVGALVLGEKERQRPREAEQRRRVASARDGLGVPPAPGHVVDGRVGDAAPHEHPAAVRGFPVERRLEVEQANRVERTADRIAAVREVLDARVREHLRHRPGHRGLVGLRGRIDDDAVTFPGPHGELHGPVQLLRRHQPGEEVGVERVQAPPARLQVTHEPRSLRRLSRRQIRVEVGGGVEREGIRGMPLLDRERLVDETVLPLERAGGQVVVAEVGLLHGQRVDRPPALRRERAAEDGLVDAVDVQCHWLRRPAHRHLERRLEIAGIVLARGDRQLVIADGESERGAAERPGRAETRGGQLHEAGRALLVEDRRVYRGVGEGGQVAVR